MKDIRGANAIVTGASRGLGVTITHDLARQGVNLTLAARSADDLARVRDELAHHGVRVAAVPCDVSDPRALEELVGKAEADVGPTDILVNNAAIEIPGSFSSYGPEDIVRVIDVNLKGAMLLTRLVLPGMLERRRGHVVNVSSLAGKGGFPYETPYSATKAGLVMFTHTLRAELDGTGVSTSVVCPGLVADDGMYARMNERGLRAPLVLWPTTPRKVGEAVVKAIERDAVELLVNRLPMRAVLALCQAFPPATGVVLKAVGVTRYGRRLAAAEDR